MENTSAAKKQLKEALSKAKPGGAQEVLDTIEVTCCRLPHEERWGFDLNCSSYHILMHPLKSQVIPSMQPAFSSSLRVDSQLSGKKRQPVGW
eukprot:1178885-Prorocentrum_minimum.AAC.3